MSTRACAESPCEGGCEDLTDYMDSGGCGTPYCSGWSEYHCRKCGWYTCECTCGFCDGQSKVPWKRVERQYKIGRSNNIGRAL